MAEMPSGVLPVRVKEILPGRRVPAVSLSCPLSQDCRSKCKEGVAGASQKPVRGAVWIIGRPLSRTK